MYGSIKTNFIIKLATTLHQSGTSTPELERELISVCDALGVKGSFLISPTSISLTLEEANEVVSQNLRVFPGSVDLYKLNQLKGLVNQLGNEGLAVEQAYDMLQKIKGERGTYSLFLTILSFSIVATCLVIFMQGKLVDMAAACVCGALVAVMVINIKSIRLEPIKETIIAFFVSTTAFAIHYFEPQVNVNIVTLSSLIILIPGLGLTISISELASKHFASGTARLMGAIVEFSKLGAGIIAAYHLASYFDFPSMNQPLVEYSIYIKALVVLICSSATSIVFNANTKDIPWILGGALFTMLFLDFAGNFLSSNLSIFLASFFAGLLSNVFALKFNKNSSTILLPSIIFLVPGVLGIKSLQLLVEQNFGLGLGEVAKTITIAILIVSGIFFADAIRPSYHIRAMKK
ncbi:MAG: threonine/serine exporter family protein [Bacteriovoracaceae bacterium]|nr:threonine/serine exporter family protein [Bacteriovoracaceae bacterium]